MKRNVPGGSARLTAGCLPVPLFNQKKRVRQPFTSSPGAAPETQDFPPLPSDFVWDMMKPEGPSLKKMMNAGPQSSAVPHLKQETGFKPDPQAVERSHNWRSWSCGEDTTKVWDRQEFKPPREGSYSVASSGPRPSLMSPEMSQKGRPSNCPQVSYQREVGVQGPGTSGRSLQMATYNSEPHQLKRKPFGNGPEENVIKEGPLCQLKLKEEDPSLRILPAVIESVKHWSEHVQCFPLLFELLAVLDSAVTPGAQGAKTFLLRDGKKTMPCVFYEIDRELPRLIRGRVHRCVGSFDRQRNLFKCVSVRPASVSEQKTFQEFVQTADATMSYYTNLRSEM